MRAPLTSAIVVVAAVAGGGAAPARQGHGATPVTVQAVIEDGQRRPISNLAPDEFTLQVDGRPVGDLAVACGTPPLALVVLIDVSVSTEPFFRPGTSSIIRATERLLSTMRDTDRVRVGAIAAVANLSPAFTSDRRQMIADAREFLKLKDRDRYGPSPIWDAVDHAVTALEGEAGRRAVILFTDGRTGGNRLGFTEMAAHAAAAGVAVNVVSPFQEEFIQQTPEVAVRVRPQVPLGHLANITGGLISTDVTDWWRFPDSTLLTMLARIRSSCAISFAPPMSDGALHRLEVVVTRAGAVAHAPQVILAQKPR